MGLRYVTFTSHFEWKIISDFLILKEAWIWLQHNKIPQMKWRQKLYRSIRSISLILKRLAATLFSLLEVFQLFLFTNMKDKRTNISKLAITTYRSQISKSGIQLTQKEIMVIKIRLKKEKKMIVGIEKVCASLRKIIMVYMSCIVIQDPKWWKSNRSWRIKLSFIISPRFQR